MVKAYRKLLAALAASLCALTAISMIPASWFLLLNHPKAPKSLLK